MAYKPHLIRWSDVKDEAVTGKMYLYPCNDKKGRPIVMMRPRWDLVKRLLALSDALLA